jgi:hypothetical protein
MAAPWHSTRGIIHSDNDDLRDRSRLSANRSWFLDDRSPPRRLQITNHPQQHVVVFSIWQDNVCTATFRLPTADSPAMIDALVTALADAAAVAAQPSARSGTWWTRAMDWARTRPTSTFGVARHCRSERSVLCLDDPGGGGDRSRARWVAWLLASMRAMLMGWRLVG